MWFSLVGLSLVFTTTTTGITLVTRKDPVDHFLIPGRCKEEACLMESSGTGELAGACTCRCLPHVPVFREDLQICVDDMHECPLAPFAAGNVLQKIPYVFLPLKGQIINPSSEIILSKISRPICVISSAKYLTTNGWMELKNKTETESPFRLYRYEGRNYLQWLGDADLRLYMEGRLMLISMMCKDGANQNNIILNPCVAFRVSGTPSETSRWSPNGVKEVTFGTEALGGSGGGGSGGGGTGGGGGMGSGYVAVALCSLALGLSYAAGVAWYLKRRSFKEGSPGSQVEGSHPGGMEEGIVKNNPLLRHCSAQDSQPYQSHHTATSSDDDDSSEIFHIHEDAPKSSSPTNQVHVTSAVVHPCCDGRDCNGENMLDPEAVDPSNMERHPEENLSIVETPEHREDRTGLVGSQPGRRKLYFNPAYFEQELLLAPPPAAIEFLTKIREVMTIAKSKMEAKRFLPSLLGIAEERELEDGSVLEAAECASCRSNKTNKGAQFGGNVASCCHNCNNENKVNSIRRWLEDVPFAKSGYPGSTIANATGQHDYPSSITSSSRDSSRNSYLSHASTIKQSTKYPDNVYSNCINKETPLDAECMKSVIDVISKPPSTITNNEDSSSEIDENIYVDQRYDRFPSKSCRDEYMDYECITENTCKELGIGIAKSGFSTPTEYADIRPNIIEKVSCSIVFNRNGNNEYLTVGSEPPIGGSADHKDDHDYEMIMVNSVDETKSLPDFAHDNHSFISEIYVSNYADRFDRDNEYPLSDSSMNSIESSSNSLPSNSIGNNNKNGRNAINSGQGPLTIKVEGHPVQKDDYESDNFEPDTLDRKPAKLTIHGAPPNPADFTVDFFTDSLERQPQIALKSSGSFRQSTLSLTNGCTANVSQINRSNGVTLTKSFGSLREIFVAKNRFNQCHHRPTSCDHLGSTASLNQLSSISNIHWNKERCRTLRPDTRQAKRQRAPSPQRFSPPPIPLDVDDDHHEYKNIPMEADVPPPLPARKNRKQMAPQPPSATDQGLSGSKREKRHNIGIRNGNVRNSIRLFNKLPETSGSSELRQLRSRHLVSGPDSNSTTEYEFMTADSREKRPQFFLRKSWAQESSGERSSTRKNYRQGHRTEDSGYLSTDSNNSEKIRREDHGSETDDSFFDGASESGAESIATDSFSFGKSLKHSTLPNHFSVHKNTPQNF